MRIRRAIAMMAPCALLTFGCGGEETTESNSGVDIAAFDSAKTDIGKRAKLIDNIGLDSEIQGQFDPAVRTYGYIIEAKKGAKLQITLEGFAGEDARGIEAGAELDTIMALYGPYESGENPGEKLIEHDDNGRSLSPAPIQFEVEQDGKYLIAFTSFDDTGSGKYTVKVGCDGTDFQCQRPDFDKPCEEGKLYVQGGVVEEDTTWDTCEVILLEPTRVAEGKILTIKPGVEVKGNYLSPNGQNFGNVTLTASTIQAVGTPEHPIAFTAFTDRGWGGLVLTGESSSLDNIYIEKANVALTLRNGATGTVSNSIIQGNFEVGGASVMGQAGIRATADVDANFIRAEVKGFQIGIDAQNAEHLVIEDSIIHGNNSGVRVSGQNRINGCRNVAQPQVWRDPKFIHTDIYDNQTGIEIWGSDILIQVEKSNIIKNRGFAIDIQGGTLNPESYVRDTNIFENNRATATDNTMQIRSFHRTGRVDISDNYWRFISDPQLSTSWNTQCNGQVDFSGFHPEKVSDAGPRKANVKTDIWSASVAETFADEE
ncbi:MAG: right-handed parallel beta-helix repeat-containing protein [Bradymonadia bacterium]